MTWIRSFSRTYTSTTREPRATWLRCSRTLPSTCTRSAAPTWLIPEAVEERDPHLRREDGRALGRDATRAGGPPRSPLRRRGARGGGRRPRGALHAGSRLPPHRLPRARVRRALRRRCRGHQAPGAVLRPPADAAP